MILCFIMEFFDIWFVKMIFSFNVLKGNIFLEIMNKYFLIIIMYEMFRFI